MKPALDDAGVELLLVSIGTLERGEDFARETAFPAEKLYADPDNVCYDALGFHRGVGRTFFDKATPFAMR